MPNRGTLLTILSVIGIVFLGCCLYVYGGRTHLGNIGLSAPNDPKVNELISQARGLQDRGKWSVGSFRQWSQIDHVPSR